MTRIASKHQKLEEAKKDHFPTGFKESMTLSTPFRLLISETVNNKLLLL